MIYKTNLYKIFTVISLGLTTFIFLIFIDKPQYYSLIPIIPLSYVILNLIFPFTLNNNFMHNVFGVMFNGIMMLRAILMPIMLGLGGFVSSKTLNIQINMPLAIMIFTYEMIFEYILVFILFRKKNRHNSAILEKRVNVHINYNRMVLLILIGIIICYILAPMATQYYRTIFGITDFSYTGFDSRVIIDTYATNLFRKFGLVTFRYIANIARLVFPAVIIVFLKKNNVHKKYARIITIILIFISSFLLVDDTIATSLVNSLILIIFYNKLYSNPKNILKYFIFAAFAAISYFLLRISLTSDLSGNSGVSIITRISNILQAYFSGINNVSAGFNLVVNDTLLLFKYGIYEFLKGIPYATTIFGLDSTNISTLYNQINGTTGQIIPTLSSSSLYFGNLLSPIYGLLFVYISFISSNDVDINTKPLRNLSSISISIYALIGISMYSPEATWAFIFSIGIGIRFLSYLFENNIVLKK